MDSLPRAWRLGRGMDSNQALRLLPSDSFNAHSHVVARVRNRLSDVDISCFADFLAYAETLGAPLDALGPDAAAMLGKTPMQASLGRQHRATTHRHLEPNMVPWGLGPQEHEARALALEHPFVGQPVAELDLAFAVDTYCALVLRVTTARSRRLRLLQRVSNALGPLDRLLLDRRHVRVAQAPGGRPVYTALLIVLVRWTDVGLPTNLALGFELAGRLPESKVLKPTDPRHSGKRFGPEDEEAVLGTSAEPFIRELESDKRRGKHCQDVWDITRQEIDEGIASPLRSKAEMDQLLGVGRWHPCLAMSYGNSTSGGPLATAGNSTSGARTNAFTEMNETMVCIPPDFAILTAKLLAMALVRTHGSIPCWFRPVLSLEDWWKGCRQLFPTKDHLGLAVVAVQNPDSGEWLYSQLFGLPFGLGSAVNQLSRGAAFLTAVNRRLLYLLTGNYVDDSATLELTPIAFLDGSASRAAKASAASCAGVMYSESNFHHHHHHPPPHHTHPASWINSWGTCTTGVDVLGSIVWPGAPSPPHVRTS